MSDGSRIPGVRLAPLAVHSDERGAFMETFRASWFDAPDRFVQGNASFSKAGVLRGLHYHLRQDDYWVVLRGRVAAGLADLRPANARIAEAHELRAGDTIYIPSGVAHGFYAREEVALAYWVTAYYDGSDELGVRWDDPELDVPWPCERPLLSQRDREAPRLADIDPSRLPPR